MEDESSAAGAHLAGVAVARFFSQCRIAVYPNPNAALISGASGVPSLHS